MIILYGKLLISSLSVHCRGNLSRIRHSRITGPHGRLFPKYVRYEHIADPRDKIPQSIHCTFINRVPVCLLMSNIPIQTWKYYKDFKTESLLLGTSAMTTS